MNRQDFKQIAEQYTKATSDLVNLLEKSVHDKINSLPKDRAEALLKTIAKYDLAGKTGNLNNELSSLRKTINDLK